MPSPRFFSTPAKFRSFLEKHHQSATELLVGFYKTSSGRPSITWPESVTEALSFGWIDGVRKSIDAERYMIRFTPRKPNSIWSNVNIKKAEELIAAGRMTAAGLAAYARRTENRSGIYAFEGKAAELDAELEKAFRGNRVAWKYFSTQAPYYRKVAAHYVASAKRPETRAKRLAALIEHSERGERIPQLVGPRARG